MTTSTFNDGELAAAARAGDKDAFGVLYRRYLEPIHDFLVRMTRDQALAEDLAQDTFIRAMQRLDQLDEPGRFRAWLYTIARTQALNRMDRESRSTPSDPSPSPDQAPGPLLSVIDPDRFSDPEEAARAAEVADLVWEAAASLDERTFTVLDLTLRHGLESSEIAGVMGVSKGNASVMVNRMKERAGNAIGTYLLIRRSACNDLAALVARADYPPVDETLRHSVDRHVEGCEECQERKRRVASPTQIMAAYAAIPPPPLLDERTWSEIEARWDTEGPGSASSGPGFLVRAGMVGAALILIFGLGVAGAVQLGEAMLEGMPLPDPSTTTSTFEVASTSSTAPDSTTSTTVAPTTTGTPTTTTPPSPTTAPPPAPTTTSPPPTVPPNQPPVVTIRRPRNGDHHQTPTFESSGMVPVAAVVTDDQDTDLVVTWASDRHPGQTWSGNQTTLELAAGCTDALTHVLTATATDSAGVTGSASVTITVGCQPAP